MAKRTNVSTCMYKTHSFHAFIYWCYTCIKIICSFYTWACKDSCKPKSVLDKIQPSLPPVNSLPHCHGNQIPPSDFSPHAWHLCGFYWALYPTTTSHWLTVQAHTVRMYMYMYSTSMACTWHTNTDMSSSEDHKIPTRIETKCCTILVQLQIIWEAFLASVLWYWHTGVVWKGLSWFCVFV